MKTHRSRYRVAIQQPRRVHTKIAGAPRKVLRLRA